MAIYIIVMVTHGKVSDFFPWASLIDDCCTLGEVVHSAWAKQPELGSGNPFIASLWTSPENFSGAGRWFALSSSLSFFSLSKAFTQYLKKLDIPSLAFLLKIHLSHAEVQIILIWHHLNSMDEQECLAFSLFHSFLIFPAHIISFNPFCLPATSCPLCRHRRHEAMSNYLWIFC